MRMTNTFGLAAGASFLEQENSSKATAIKFKYLIITVSGQGQKLRILGCSGFTIQNQRVQGF